jgi:hypothetical protein
MSARRLMTPAVVLALLAPAASAEVTKPGISPFRGKLVVTKGDLPEGKTDRDTIKKIRADEVKELVGETRDEVTYWTFHYTAFLSRTGATALKMEFLRDGKQYSADKRLDGVDPKISVITGEIAISEDDGLAKGKSYVIKLVNSKDQVVAQTKLLMK